MRLVFDNLDEFKKWFSDNVSSDKYECYITNDGEYILVPTKSTRPLKYGYYKTDSEALKKEVEELIGKTLKGVYRVKTVEWADDRAVGMEKLMRVEE